MFKAGLPKCIVIMMATTLPVTAQEASRSAIVVVGRGSVAATPDRASLIVEVLTEAPTPQAAATENAAKMQSVTAALSRIGYTESTFNTISYSVQPTYRYRDGEREHTGYSATNAIAVRVDSIDEIGSVLDTVLASGATRIRGVRFESSRARELRAQAMEEAVADARRSAEVLARAAGGQLGALVLLSTESPSRDYSYSYEMAEMELAPMLEIPTPIAPGDQVITATVYARWEFVSR